MIEPVITYLEQGDNEAQTSSIGKAQHLRPRLWAREFSGLGEPRGTLAMMHDHGEHGGRYSRLGGRFAEAGWAVTVFDFRGHGDSDGERNGAFHSARELLDDVDLAMQHVAYQLPEAPRVAVGAGLGGLVAMAYAIQCADRCAGFAALNPDVRPGPAFKKSGFLSGLFGGGVLGIEARDRFRDPAKATAFENEKKITMKRDGKTTAAVEELRRLVADGMAKLERPGFVVVSRDDRIADAEATKDAVRRAQGRVELLEVDLGHSIVDDAESERALEPLFAFLDRNYPRGVAKLPTI